MTPQRKQELETRAHELIEACLYEGICLADGEASIIAKILISHFEQVEREVWARIISEIDYRHTTVTMQQITLKEWCMAQYLSSK